MITRSLLYFDPFPPTMGKGKEAEVWDIDCHHYIGCVGEFSAGLYGHTDLIMKAAIVEAPEAGIKSSCSGRPIMAASNSLGRVTGKYFNQSREISDAIRECASARSKRR
jgi:glutamate-1-semialdehyde aminotransferase